MEHQSHPEIKFIFANINDWLKFAEAKHGGLIVLNSGLLVGIITGYRNIQGSIFKEALITGIICFGISIFLSIVSQFPITQISFFHEKDVN